MAQACIGDTAFAGVLDVLRPQYAVRLAKSGVALRFPPHSKTLRVRASVALCYPIFTTPTVVLS